MKVLVTGAAGRLGKQLVHLLSKNECDIVAFDLPSVSWEHIENIKHTESFPADITNPDSVKEACYGIDVVFHLAALLPPKSEYNKNLTLRVNVEGTENILRALKEKTVIILASSISTYGITHNEPLLLTEDHPQKSHNFYSESKIEAERIIRASEIPYVVLRIAPIAIADLVELPDIVPYKADQRVEFIYVEDAARALFSAAVNKKALGRIFNIAGGASWQMTGAKYIERFYEVLGVDVEPNFNKEYTALDWYDTSRSAIIDYQRVTFDKFLEKLKRIAIELGLI
jgi:nucleoside-diphosphate-sugar epimerase